MFKCLGDFKVFTLLYLIPEFCKSLVCRSLAPIFSIGLPPYHLCSTLLAWDLHCTFPFDSFKSKVLFLLDAGEPHRKFLTANHDTSASDLKSCGGSSYTWYALLFLPLAWSTSFRTCARISDVKTTLDFSWYLLINDLQ